MGENTRRYFWMGLIALVVIGLAISGIRYFGSSRLSSPPLDEEEFDSDPYVVRSTPNSADVYINNVFAGTTPYRYESFDPGILRLRLEHAGLAPVETVLIVRDDAPVPVFPRFVFRLPVELASIPPGAQPIVDGRPLRAYEAASLTLPASDTVEVSFVLEGEPSKSVRFCPTKGIIGETDTTTWNWRPYTPSSPAQLVGVFALMMRVESEPPGAEIYLDSDTQPLGRTNSRVPVPYGTHRLTLRMPPFDDQTIVVESGRDRMEPVSVLLGRTVWITAVDAANPYKDLKARVSWVRQGSQYVVNPDHEISTPNAISIPGRPCELRLSCPGFADTTILLAASAHEIIVEMHRTSRERPREDVQADDQFGWVRFIVREGRRNALPGAEVFGVEKHDGRIVRFGPTDADGSITTRVPIGDYDWWAAKEGFTGHPNGERVKSGRKTKEIKLKVKPL